MAKNSKALIFLAFGAFTAFLGTGIICGGGFNSVMFSPTQGPYQVTVTGTTTTTGTAATTTATAAILQNNGHFASLLKQYPELFNWSKLKTLQASVDASAAFAGVTLDQQVARDAAVAYTQYHAGEQAWIFAFYLPLSLVVVALGVTAFARKSGYTIALVGLGLAATMVSYTLVIVVHYQNISFVPLALNAFADCASVDATTRAALLANTQYGTLVGPAPRRAWLCKQDYTYDNDFRTAANLVWGGAATCFIGYISLLLGFAYLVQPFVTPVQAFAKASSYRDSNIAADEDYDYSEDYSESEY